MAALIRPEQLVDVLHRPGLARQDKLLLTLGSFQTRPVAIAAVRAQAKQAGLREIEKWSVSGTLGAAKGLAIDTGHGWDLTAAGRAAVQKLLGSEGQTPTAGVSNDLRNAVNGLSDANARAFVLEAIACFEARQFKAAVVFSWVGAVATLYDHILKAHLASFNAEAGRRDKNWRPAKIADDCTRMKEYDFLQVLESISVFGKSVKTELEAALKLRNGCGHPNSLKVSEHRAAGHIESLVLNVFSVYT